MFISLRTGVYGRSLVALTLAGIMLVTNAETQPHRDTWTKPTATTQSLSGWNQFEGIQTDERESIFFGFGDSETQLLYNPHLNEIVDSFNASSSLKRVERPAVVANFEGFIWTHGGYNPDGKELVNTMQRSADGGKSWTTLPIFKRESYYSYSTLCDEDEIQTIRSSHRTKPDVCTFWAPRVGAQAIVFQSKMYLLGGTVYSSIDSRYHRRSDVWLYMGYHRQIHRSRTYEGYKWKRLAATSIWSSRSEHRCVVYQKKLFIIGGLQDSASASHGQALNDVYYAVSHKSSASEADLKWTIATEAAEFSPRAGAALVNYKDQTLYLFGGYAFTPNEDQFVVYSDVWVSTNGKYWQLIYETGVSYRPVLLSSTPVNLAYYMPDPPTFIRIKNLVNQPAEYVVMSERVATLPFLMESSQQLSCYSQNATVCNGLGTCVDGECQCEKRHENKGHVIRDPLAKCRWTCEVGYELAYVDATLTMQDCFPCPKGNYGAIDIENNSMCFPCSSTHTTLGVASVGRSACNISLSDTLQQIDEESGLNRGVNYGICRGGVCLTFHIIVGALALIVVTAIVAYQRQRRRRWEAWEANANPLAPEDDKGSKFGRPHQDSRLCYDTLSPSQKAAVYYVLNNDQSFQDVQLDADEVILTKVIGNGAFGEVLLGSYEGEPVAVKRLHRNRVTAECIQQFAQEVEILQTLNHPNILQFLGVTWTDCYDISLVTEWVAQGDLHSVLLDSSILLDWRHRNITMSLDIAQGLNYLHQRNPPLVHRDLKSMNVLVDVDFTCKISDFGLSRTCSTEDTMTATGTSFWFAPEMIKGEKFDERIDIYSFGIVLAEIDTRKLPFQDLQDQAEQNERKLTGTHVMHLVAYEGLRPTLSSTCPQFIKDLVWQCTDINPANRPSAGKIISTLKKHLPKDYSIFDSQFSSRDSFSI